MAYPTKASEGNQKRSPEARFEEAAEHVSPNSPKGCSDTTCGYELVLAPQHGGFWGTRFGLFSMRNVGQSHIGSSSMGDCGGGAFWPINDGDSKGKSFWLIQHEGFLRIAISVHPACGFRAKSFWPIQHRRF